MDKISKVNITHLHKKIKRVSWEDVDEGCKVLAEAIKHTIPKLEGTSIYPVPRGGMIPAVIISHILNLPIVDKPNLHSVIIDDIEDSGKTLMKYYENYTFVLYSKRIKRGDRRTDSTFTYSLITEDTWLIFPWENQDV